MKNLQISILAAATLALGATGAANAQSLDPSAASGAKLVVGVYNSAEPAQLEKTQFFYGGRNYCWYLEGWRGPGYYWCGFNWRRGFGWGGGYGWNNWGGGWRDGWAGNGWHRGYVGPGSPGYGLRAARAGYRPGWHNHHGWHANAAIARSRAIHERQFMRHHHRRPY